MDLIGFWELVSIQVDQSKSSLKELHDKKDNDWKVNILTIKLCLKYQIRPRGHSEKLELRDETSDFTILLWADFYDEQLVPISDNSQKKKFWNIFWEILEFDKIFRKSKKKKRR